MRKKSSTFILVIIMLIGIGLMLYPSISDYLNSRNQSRAIVSYVESVAEIDNTANELMRQEAAQYNEYLRQKLDRYDNEEGEQDKLYNSLLDPLGSGIMGYIEIPKINCRLPIYHGIDDSVLQVAVGHIQGTSLPIGGESTHCALSGHRGLPSARLFTDIDQLVEGDTFTMYVLDLELTYQVDQILVVEPDELDALEISEGNDYCTLITCTPYGVNTHRLLVRGRRIETPQDIVLPQPTLPDISNQTSQDDNALGMYDSAYVNVLIFCAVCLAAIVKMMTDQIRSKKDSEE